MRTILEQIIANKKLEIMKKRKIVVFDAMKKRAKAKKREQFVFCKALQGRTHTPAIIAEIKFASPSHGVFKTNLSLQDRIRSYEENGADAISLVVDEKFFHGKIGLVSEIKEITPLPLLAKDFVIDQYQIYELANKGADAILLIAKILSEDSLNEYVTIAHSLGVEPLIEVQNEEELIRALRTSTICIAVNARNLSDFSVNVDEACNLIKKIPKDRLRLGFSGVKERLEYMAYKEAGVDAVLIGTALMETDDIQGVFERIIV